MRINWLGHASFLLITEDITIITDPFDPRVGYRLYEGPVDVATVSHGHNDHNAVGFLKARPRVIDKPGSYEIKSAAIKGISSFHDQKRGRERGQNIIFKMVLDNIRIVHLGDLGHIPDKEQVEAIGEVDILLVPVGGTYTINAAEAFSVVELLQPRIVIPMHYKTPHCTIQLDPLERFTARFDKFARVPVLEVDQNSLKDKPGVVVMEYPAP